MKSKVKLYICVVLIIVMLAGCGSEASSQESTPTPAPENPVVTNVPSDEKNSDEKPLGILSEFSAKGLDDKDYDQSLFEGHKVTMINIWGTFCGPCIREMPFLGELSREYDNADLQIIGLICDVADQNMNPIDSAISDAKDIVAQTKADYIHLLPSASLQERVLFQVDAVPLTFFVDENGVQVGEAYVGSREKKAWEKIINGILEK